MRSAPSAPYSPRHPFQDGTKGQGRKRLLSSKRPMRLSKITPPFGPARHEGRGIGPTKSSPASLRDERTRAQGHRIWDLQPHGPSLPETRDDTQGYHRPDWKEQPLRCGRPDLVPKGASFKVSPELPREEPSCDGDRRWCLSAPASRPHHPVHRGRSRLSAGHQKWCGPTELQGLENQTSAVGSTPSGEDLKWCLAAPTSSPGGPVPSSRTASPWKPKWWPAPPSQASRMRPRKRPRLAADRLSSGGASPLQVPRRTFRTDTAKAE
jgi:hypothetical protein